MTDIDKLARSVAERSLDRQLIFEGASEEEIAGLNAEQKQRLLDKIRRIKYHKNTQPVSWLGEGKN